MVDLTREMADLMSALGRPQGKGGRVLMFVSALGGEGTSTVAREYSRCEAAFAAKPIWLVDADLRNPAQMIAVGQDAARFGPPGPLSQASPDGSVFFTLSPPARGSDGLPIADSRYLVARPFLDKRLWVTRFRHEKMGPGQRVKLFDQTTYWRALRAHAETVIVDVPALDRSTAALQLAPFMDGIILVVSETEGDVQARVNLKNDLEQAGGRVLGLVYNRASHPSKSAVSPPAGFKGFGRIAAL